MRHPFGAVGIMVAAVVMASLAGARVVATQQASTNQAPTAAPASSGTGENGKALFAKYGCAKCHGLEGQGSPTSGPRVGPNPLPLPAFTRYLRTPRNQMPPYTDAVVPDQDVKEIHAYLVARARPATTPLLQPEK